MEAVLNLLFNGIIMLALLALYSINKFEYKKGSYLRKLIRGLFIGIIIILVMSKPWESSKTGEIYDSRNIVLSISGVFFGTIPTLVAGFLSIGYRIFLGGTGVFLGIIEIIISVSIGLIWPFITKNINKKYKILEYFLLGFSVHVIVLLIYFIVPSEMQNSVNELLIPYLLIYPLFTVAASLILMNHYSYINLTEKSRRQEEMLHATINASKSMEVYALNNNYEYIAYNDFHRDMMERYYLRNIEKGKVFFNYIENKEMIRRLKSSINKSMLGVEHKVISEIEVTPNKFVNETFSPIYSKEGKVVGVTVFSHDVSEKVNQRNELEYLSYHDHLTNIYNRRYFDMLISKYNKYKGVLTVLYFDINGLKVINDTFGHKEGDKLIVNVVNEIKSHLDYDTELCRIGGDEFIVFLPNVKFEEAIKTGNNIKSSISKLNIKNINYSISFGAATNIDRSIEDAISEAENRMNRNKLVEKSSHRGANIPAIIQTLELINANDPEHSKRVSSFVEIISNELQLSETMLGLLKMIAKLHDVGKIGIDQDILNKPGPLTEEEFKEIKRHPMIGYQLLAQVPEYSEIAYDVLSHHERYDGNGYPNGLKGTNIPFRARVISVADAFDAMTSDRPYKKAISNKEAIKELERCSGTQFDPRIVNAFIKGYKKEVLNEKDD